MTLKAGEVLFIPAGTTTRRETSAPAAEGSSPLIVEKGKPLITVVQ